MESDVQVLTPEPTAEQPSLLPDTRPASWLAQVPLDRLPPSDDITYAGRTVLPTSDIARSVAAFGVHTPITLRQQADGSYRVEAGRKRILAARLAGCTEIPAQVYDDMAWNKPGVLTLSENEHRSPNVYGEMFAISHLLDQGYSVDQIAGQLAIKKQRITFLLGFQNLHLTLLHAMATGEIKPGTAHAIARLPIAAQSRLASAYEAGERVTGQMVREARSAQRASSLADLDLGLAIDVPEPMASEPDHAMVADELDNAVGILLKSLAVLDASDDAAKIALDVFRAEADIYVCLEERGGHGKDLALAAWQHGTETFKRASHYGGSTANARSAVYALIAAVAIARMPNLESDEEPVE